MSRRTTLFLFLLVVAVGAGIYWQQRKSASGAFAPVERLFPGVDIARVTRMRLENLEYSQQIEIEREPDGWRIVDPLDYPASPGLVRELLGVIERNLAAKVPGAELDDALAGLEMPSAVIEVFEELGDRERMTRVEVGDVDLDAARVFVRRDGTVFRTMRNLDTALRHDVHEYRNPRVFALGVDDVVALRRGGFLLSDSGSRPLAFDARRDAGAWWMDAPVQAQLDPNAMRLFIGGLTAIKVEAFVDDDPGDLAEFGLEAPEITLELEGRSGEVEQLDFARAIEQGSWFCKRRDLPFVWQVDGNVLVDVRRPFVGMLDHQLLRMFRADVERLELVGDERKIVLERQRDPRASQRDAASDSWSVSHGPRDGDLSSAVRADAERVEDAIAVLEKAQLRFLPDLPLADAFPEDGRLRAIRVTDVRGLVQGWLVGERTETEDGTPGRLFRRERQTIASMVPLEVEALLQLPPEHFYSRLVLGLTEQELARMSFAHAGETRRYVRSHEGKWTYPDSSFEATELRAVLDPLMYLRAESHVPPGEVTPFEDFVLVEVVSRRGDVETVLIGRTGAGRIECERLGNRAVLARPELFEQLAGIVEGTGAGANGD